MKAQRRDPVFVEKFAQAIQERPTEYISERNRQRWQDPVYREQQTTRIREMQPRLLAARRTMMLNYWTAPRRAALSLASAARWRSPDYRARFFASWMPVFANRLKPSGLHTSVKNAMIAASLSMFTTHVVVGPYCLDEADTSRKLAVEINGCYWHGCAEHTRGKNLSRKISRRVADDKRRSTYLKNHGWQLLEIWEHDWQNDPQACITKMIIFTKE